MGLGRALVSLLQLEQALAGRRLRSVRAVVGQPATQPQLGRPVCAPRPVGLRPRPASYHLCVFLPPWRFAKEGENRYRKPSASNRPDAPRVQTRLLGPDDELDSPVQKLLRMPLAQEKQLPQHLRRVPPLPTHLPKLPVETPEELPLERDALEELPPEPAMLPSCW